MNLVSVSLDTKVETLTSECNCCETRSVTLVFDEAKRQRVRRCSGNA